MLSEVGVSCADLELLYTDSEYQTWQLSTKCEAVSTIEGRTRAYLSDYDDTHGGRFYQAPQPTSFGQH